MAFREKGHEAYSCDIIECSGGHPEWHIKQDVIPLINGDCKFKTMDGKEHNIEGKWDLIIAHPPCTYLSKVATKHLFQNGVINQERYEKGLAAKDFFMKLYMADCEKIAVENPVPFKMFELPERTQIIHPYYFGDPYKKMTCLWLKNLPKLVPTNIVEGQSTSSKKSWFNKGGKDRQKNRSKTFPGIAKAMADQWGNVNTNKLN